jgi:hypothetical protein
MPEQKGQSFFVHNIIYAQIKAEKQHRLAYIPRMTTREELRMRRREEPRVMSGGGAIDRGSGRSVKSGLEAEDLPESRLPGNVNAGIPKGTSDCQLPFEKGPRITRRGAKNGF